GACENDERLARPGAGAEEEDRVGLEMADGGDAARGCDLDLPCRPPEVGAEAAAIETEGGGEASRALRLPARDAALEAAPVGQLEEVPATLLSGGGVRGERE